MRDLAFVGFLVALLAMGLKRPFLFVMAYAYVDIVAPQRLSFVLLNSMPLSQIMAALALGSWFFVDDKRHFAVTPRQWLILLLLGYCALTTVHADLPGEAWLKWDWAWKALAFGIFLPLTLRTKLRIETCLLFMALCAGAIIIVGGIKTALSGGGYGALNLMVDNNSGLYEGSIISTFAIALIPIILWFARFGTIFPSDWRTKAFCGALIFACLLIPIGTEARTGLICIGVLAMLTLRDVKRRLLYIAGAGLLGLAAIPFLPSSFTNRMETIQGYQADESANTRLAVWGWTLEYVQTRPFGGGFEAYRQNRIAVQTVAQSNCRRRPDGRRPGPGRLGTRLSQRLFRDARRAGLSGSPPVPAHSRYRPGADGGAAPTLSRPRRRACVDRTPGNRSPAFPDRLSGRRPVRRRRLPALHHGWRWRSRSASTAG